ncbi:TPA: hypothetical protein DF272_04605 [Candidatus Falkowbacteria bacterium]|nr:hypothetical protein [Candidatus Falkowbacteria bacterium]
MANEDLRLCSFCGKSQREVKILIVGPDVTICDECVGLSNDILVEEGLPGAMRVKFVGDKFILTLGRDGHVMAFECPLSYQDGKWDELIQFLRGVCHLTQEFDQRMLDLIELNRKLEAAREQHFKTQKDVEAIEIIIRELTGREPEF